MEKELIIYMKYLQILHPELNKNQFKCRKATFKKNHNMETKSRYYLHPNVFPIDIKFKIFKDKIYNKINFNEFEQNRIHNFNMNNIPRNKQECIGAYIETYYGKFGFDYPERMTSTKSTLKKCVIDNSFITPSQKLYRLINEFKYFEHLKKEKKRKEDYKIIIDGISKCEKNEKLII